MRQITKKNGLTLLMLILVAFFTTNCKSTKKVSEAQTPKAVFEDEVEIKQFCSSMDYPSTAEIIRAGSLGESTDMVMSKKVAKSNTLEELGSKIEVTVKAVIDNYNNRRQKDITESVEKRYEELIRTIVNQKITGYKTACDKTTKTKEGKYRTYLVYELPVDNVLNPVYTSISKDDELKVDYDYQKFKNTFEEEMKKSENQ
jgi:hypothetical protein